MGLIGTAIAARQYNKSAKAAKKEGRRGRAHAKLMQRRQMDYETEMSNSAHQRQVADLRKAGLNPILAANQGASTPAVTGSGSYTSEASDISSAYKGKADALSKLEIAQTGLLAAQTNSAVQAGKLSHQQSEGHKFDNAEKQVKYDVINTARSALGKFGEFLTTSPDPQASAKGAAAGKKTLKFLKGIFGTKGMLGNQEPASQRMNPQMEAYIRKHGNLKGYKGPRSK